MTEPASTVLLPSLSVDNKTWSLNQKENPKLTINGVFAISKGVSKGLFTNDKLSGLRWLETSTKRSPLPITSKNGEYAGVVVLTNPKVRKKLDIVNGMPQYRVHVNLHGNVVEALNDMNKTQLEQLVASEVRDEILTTFKNGVNVDTDLYSLEHVLFKKDTRLWKKINKSAAQPIEPDSLVTVDVEVHLDHAGMKLLHHHYGPITPDGQYETDS